MQLIQTVAPTQEPITLEAAKAFLRILDESDDTFDTSIATLISATRESVEDITNRQVCEATYELYADRFITKLPKNPINSIVKIENMLEDGTYAEMPNTSYYLYEENGVGCIKYTEYPVLQDHKKALKITFICGYENGKIPKKILQYMEINIKTNFNIEEDIVIGASVSFTDLSKNLLSSLAIRSI